MKLKFPSSLLPLVMTSLVVLGIPRCVCQNDQKDCSQPFECGSFRENGYPFWGGNRPLSCGYPGFELYCQGPQNIPMLNISSISYIVLAIDHSTRTLRVSRNDMSLTFCPRFLFNTTLNFNLFNFYSPANDQNITLYYGCSFRIPPSVPHPFTCNVNGTNSWSLYVTGKPSGLGNDITCNTSISVRVNQYDAQHLADPTLTSTNLLQCALRSGFSIQWSAENERCDNCVQSSGLCGYNQDSASFACHCTDGPNDSACNRSTIGNGSKKGLFHLHEYIITGVSLSIVILSIILYFIRKQCKVFDPDHHESNHTVDKFLLKNGSLAPKRYNYNEIKKITQSFTDKLGQGGYGIVYRGKLPDGQLVAVKVLTQTSDNMEEFINEVSSISRTSHVNIVNLLGFYHGRKKRALVYEFMPNKSLDKFIYKSGSVNPECSLGWEKLYEIAVGVARGLEYLHRGCNTRIVHFDIKPQNILLDQDFCPKISDFGLAKLSKTKQSIISMVGARGTIGYIAPEVFSRNFGVVSHKSDVYSFGMMLLEMAEARKIAEIEVIQSSENYFPDKIYEHVLLKNENLGDHMIEEKEETVRKMLLVGLWCIQTAPLNRPSMTKVVEMLEGSLKSIKIPPKPYLYSPNLSRQQFSSSWSINVETENPTEG